MLGKEVRLDIVQSGNELGAGFPTALVRDDLFQRQVRVRTAAVPMAVDFDPKNFLSLGGKLHVVDIARRLELPRHLRRHSDLLGDVGSAVWLDFQE